MKLSTILLASAMHETSKAAGGFQFNIEKCDMDNLLESTPVNGVYECVSKKCTLECDAGFQLSGKKTIRCKKNNKGQFFWNKNKIGACVQCGPVTLGDENLETGCSVKKGQYQCAYECKHDMNVVTPHKETRRVVNKCKCKKDQGKLTRTCSWWEGKHLVDPEEYTCAAKPTTGPMTSETTKPMTSETTKPMTSETTKPMTSMTTKPDSTTKPEPTTAVGDDDLIDSGLKVGCSRNDFADGKIVGGLTAAAHSWPWIVGFSETGTPKKLWCGGTIIHDRWVLTAAHCCGGAMPAINVGRHDRTNLNVGFSVNAVKEFIHPGYNGATGTHNDVCLYKIPSLTNQQENCEDCWKTACLPTKAPTANKKCWVAGWGTLASEGNQPKKLKSVSATIFSKKKCENQSQYSGDDAITAPYEICAGDLAGGEDSCQGDSGGPLVCKSGGEPTVVGVVSWGIGCAEPGYPGVYANVHQYVDWIKETVNNN